MGASLAKVRAGNVRGCCGLEVELEGEGLIAIVKCFGVNGNDERQFVYINTFYLNCLIDKSALASTNLLSSSASACAFDFCYNSILHSLLCA